MTKTKTKKKRGRPLAERLVRRFADCEKCKRRVSVQMARFDGALERVITCRRCDPEKHAILAMRNPAGVQYIVLVRGDDGSIEAHPTYDVAREMAARNPVGAAMVRMGAGGAP